MAEVELHSSALAALCRVCGKRLDNQRVSYFCSSHAEGLRRAFGLTTAGDSHEIHPQKFCNGCYRALTQYMKVEEEGRDYNSAISVVEWREHTDHECQTCQLYTRSKVGGRPPKGRKNRGRPRNVELEEATVSRSELKQQAKAVAGPSFNSQAALHPARLIHHIGMQNLICGLCNNVVNEPVETRCSHLVCSSCFCDSIDRARTGVPSCPVCKVEFAAKSDIHAVSPVVQRMLRKLEIRCDNFQAGCTTVVTLQELHDHTVQCAPPTRSSIEISPAVSLASHSAMHPPASTSNTQLTPTKISAILSRPMNTPLSRPESKAMTHLVKCAMNAQVQSTFDLECPTGGQVSSHYSCQEHIQVIAFTYMYM